MKNLENENRLLRKALSVALGYAVQHQPGDSRAVDDWFVACAAAESGLNDNDGKIEACLDGAIAQLTAAGPDVVHNAILDRIGHLTPDCPAHFVGQIEAWADGYATAVAQVCNIVSGEDVTVSVEILDGE